MSILSSFRKSLNISQSQAANVLGVSLRTYQRYEKDEALSDNKLKSIEVLLNHEFGITETKGLLTVDGIRSKVLPVLDKYGIEMCILFGSYAKGKARESSDVDLLVKTDITGITFFTLVDSLKECLHKNVDLITTSELVKNKDILEEILVTGVRIK